MLWRSLVLCLVGAACAFAANANPALKGADRCGMQMPVRLLLSLATPPLSVCVVLFSCSEGPAGAPPGMEARGKLGRDLGASVVQLPPLISTWWPAQLWCCAKRCSLRVAQLPSSSSFSRKLTSSLFPLRFPFATPHAKHYRPRVRRWLRQRDNTCTRLQRARGTH